MDSRTNPPRLPVIDLSLFDLGDPWRSQVAAQVDAASSEFGCFVVVGHGIDVGVVEPLMAAGRRFFATEDAVKRRLQVESHARARQDDFSPVEELAARSADLRDLFFEAQLTLRNDPVTADSSGSRLSFLPDVPGLREPVLDYMRSLSGLSHKLMAMLARGLHLADSYFVDRYTGSPATSFRILHYPQVATERAADPAAGGSAQPGFLTLLKQDAGGGLELNYRQRWVALPSVPNSFICNLGQALARLTNGRYVSCAHRMRNSTQTHRLSMAFCFEPTINAALEPIAGVGPGDSRPRSDDEAANALAGHRQIA
jgi:polar amino acid transport system ATP-binding protein